MDRSLVTELPGVKLFLVKQADGLIPAEVELRWKTAPPGTYFLDASLRPGSKWGMLALIVKALQAPACGLARNAYG